MSRDYSVRSVGVQRGGGPVVAIVGTRSFLDGAMFGDDKRCEVVDAALSDHNIEPGRVISGGASGADYCAEVWAEARDVPMTIFPAQWDQYGNKAGPLRNDEVVKAADVVVAFWNGSSSGTQDTISKARSEGDTKVVVIRYDKL